MHMNRQQRERVVAEWREALRPLLEEKVVTQEHVANRLAGYYGDPIDQTKVSRWLVSTTPQPGVMSAIVRMKNEIEAGIWPTDGEELAPIEASGGAPGWLPDWLRDAWVADARASLKRAEALDKFAEAARLEAETARDRQRLLSPGGREREIAEQGQAAIDLERRKRSASRSDDTPPPQSRDRPEGGTGPGSDEPSSS